MNPRFKRVPAIDKCFAILDFMAKAKKPLGLSEISSALGLNKSTVFNTVYTLESLRVLESQGDGKFVFGTGLYVLSNIAGRSAPLLKTAHPYLELINEKTKLSAFLGLRSECRAILIDKVDSAYGVKVSSEIGIQMPVLAGAGIKAMLAQLSDEEIDELMADIELKRYTPNSIVDKEAYKEEIRAVRSSGIAYDKEEYIQGMVAFGIPVRSNGRGVQAAIWAAGLTSQVPDWYVPELVGFLKGIREEIDYRLQ